MSEVLHVAWTVVVLGGGVIVWAAWILWRDNGQSMGHRVHPEE